MTKSQTEGKKDFDIEKEIGKSMRVLDVQNYCDMYGLRYSQGVKGLQLRKLTANGETEGVFRFDDLEKFIESILISRRTNE